MATQLSFPQALAGRTLPLEERIQGTTLFRVIGEFVSTSALFPILDAIRAIAGEGWLRYLSEPAHYVLFGAAFIQAWFLGTTRSERWQVRFLGNLLGFGLYAPIDLSIEGIEFFSEPYHWLFGGFSLLTAIPGLGRWRREDLGQEKKGGYNQGKTGEQRRSRWFGR